MSVTWPTTPPPEFSKAHKNFGEFKQRALHYLRPVNHYYSGVCIDLDFQKALESPLLITFQAIWEGFFLGVDLPIIDSDGTNRHNGIIAGSSSKRVEGCCGLHAVNVHRLYNLVNLFQGSGFTLKFLASALADLVADPDKTRRYYKFDYTYDHHKEGDYVKRPGAIICTTSSKENMRDEVRMLKALGFVEIVSFLNGNTGATITQWMYVKEPEIHDID